MKSVIFHGILLKQLRRASDIRTWHKDVYVYMCYIVYIAQIKWFSSQEIYNCYVKDLVCFSYEAHTHRDLKTSDKKPLIYEISFSLFDAEIIRDLDNSQKFNIYNFFLPKERGEAFQMVSCPQVAHSNKLKISIFSCMKKSDNALSSRQQGPAEGVAAAAPA